MPLVCGDEYEQVNEAEETVTDSHHSGNEAGQSPDDQHGRGQCEVVFASECFQSFGEEGEKGQEDGVGGGVPPHVHA